VNARVQLGKNIASATDLHPPTQNKMQAQQAENKIRNQHRLQRLVEYAIFRERFLDVLDVNTFLEELDEKGIVLRSTIRSFIDNKFNNSEFPTELFSRDRPPFEIKISAPNSETIVVIKVHRVDEISAHNHYIASNRYTHCSLTIGKDEYRHVRIEDAAQLIARECWSMNFNNVEFAIHVENSCYKLQMNDGVEECVRVKSDEEPESEDSQDLDLIELYSDVDDFRMDDYKIKLVLTRDNFQNFQICVSQGKVFIKDETDTFNRVEFCPDSVYCHIMKQLDLKDADSKSKITWTKTGPKEQNTSGDILQYKLYQFVSNFMTQGVLDTLDMNLVAFPIAMFSD